MQKPRARFSISVRSKSPGAFVGSITYRDRAADLRFRSTEIVGITRTGATATITGSGSANGEPVTYVVTVTDARPDRFSIRLSNGYSADSALKTGKIRIRDRCDNDDDD